MHVKEITQMPAHKYIIEIRTENLDIKSIYIYIYISSKQLNITIQDVRYILYNGI